MVEESSRDPERGGYGCQRTKEEQKYIQPRFQIVQTMLLHYLLLADPLSHNWLYKEKIEKNACFLMKSLLKELAIRARLSRDIDILLHKRNIGLASFQVANLITVSLYLPIVITIFKALIQSGMHPQKIRHQLFFSMASMVAFWDSSAILVDPLQFMSYDLTIIHDS